ncbi:uncharacterized protein TM35_000062660 [Trypanosoma theileri]|uniref:Uncharacterized protein n=1 Tax=Trypanosoma theileri TaxID=67003 RepID=A0A1X0P330_9TRYP|nr:uncharacterized protein TM35_000062660 [Trypanosoma theileri]ORC91261.1 hypothetical protein TM35_000062660 [Trypanosoma theileri]
MFVQLRGVVCLLVLLHCCVCVVTGEVAEVEPVECTDGEFMYTERSLNGSLMGADEILADGKTCLEVWKAEADECNKNADGVSADAASIDELVRQIKEKKKEEVMCEEVKKILQRYNESVEKSAKIAELTRNTKVVCESSAVGNLQNRVESIGKRLEVYRGYVFDDSDYTKCRRDWRTSRVTEIEVKYKLMNDVKAQMDDVRAKTQLCRVKSYVQSPNDVMKGAIADYNRVCETDVDIKYLKQVPSVEKITKDGGTVQSTPDTRTKVVGAIKFSNGTTVKEVREGEIDQETEVKNETFLVDVNGGAPRISQKNIQEIERKFKELRPKVGEELKREEGKRLAEERMRLERLAEEERKRQEKLAEEDRKRQVKLVEEERKKQEKLAEEERRKRDKQDEEERKKQEKLAEEEKAKQELERKAKEEVERAKKAKKKDSSLSPALEHSPLLLLLLSVLGCTLVC